MTSLESRDEIVQPPGGPVEVGGWQRSEIQERLGPAKLQQNGTQAPTESTKLSPASSGALDEQFDEDEGITPSPPPPLLSRDHADFTTLRRSSVGLKLLEGTKTPQDFLACSCCSILTQCCSYRLHRLFCFTTCCYYTFKRPA